MENLTRAGLTFSFWPFSISIMHNNRGTTEHFVYVESGSNFLGRQPWIDLPFNYPYLKRVKIRLSLCLSTIQ